MEMEALYDEARLLSFLHQNVKKHPGKTGLKFNITEPRINAKVSLFYA